MVITGAGSGIGRATARRFAAEGKCAIALLGRRPQPLAEVAAEVEKAGSQALPLSMDVTKAKTVEEAVQEVANRFGRIDILVNNAGLAAEALLVHDTSDANWNEMLEVNLMGAVRMTREILPHFLSQNRGSIVNVSSIAGVTAMGRMSCYSASKAALVSLSRSVAIEYARAGIRCNCVCPGTVDTPMTEGFLSDPDRRTAVTSSIPMGRLAFPSDIAEAIWFLGSERASFITGAILVADGGYSAV